MKIKLDYAINPTETALVCGKNKGDKIKVYITKLLPLVTFAQPKITPVALNKGCFCNSNDCKVTPSASIKEQNYLELPITKSSILNPSYLSHGDKVRLRIGNFMDIKSMSVASGIADN